MFWSSDILVEIANAKENWAEKEGNLEKLLENNKNCKKRFYLLPVHDCFVIHNVTATVANRCSGKGESWTR